VLSALGAFQWSLAALPYEQIAHRRGMSAPTTRSPHTTGIQRLSYPIVSANARHLDNPDDGQDT
jgi:hypothetical protein